MSYRVILPQSVQNQLDKLPDDITRRILRGLSELEVNPRPPGVKKLKGRSGYRIPVGDYRIIYEIQEQLRQVIVILLYTAATCIGKAADHSGVLSLPQHDPCGRDSRASAQEGHSSGGQGQAQPVAIRSSFLRRQIVASYSALMVIAIAGDLHGALDALYERLRSWEARWGKRIDLVLQCGDLGAFGTGSAIDRATAKRAREDPTELQGRDYLSGHKRASHETWFVRGNHEDFELLSSRPDLPIDPGGRIRHLSGGKVYPVLGGRLRIAALGGIQPRKVREPGLAKYVAAHEVEALLALPEKSADILLTHDGPIGRSLQGMPSAGSVGVYDLLKRLRPRWHFFGHYDRPLPPFELFGCRCVCANQPGPARLPGRDGAVARLDPEEDTLAWIDPDGSERPG